MCIVLYMLCVVCVLWVRVRHTHSTHTYTTLKQHTHCSPYTLHILCTDTHTQVLVRCSRIVGTDAWHTHTHKPILTARPDSSHTHTHTHLGVGKNMLADRLLELLCREREYVQLHRDTSVQSLSVTPVLRGRVVRTCLCVWLCVLCVTVWGCVCLCVDYLCSISLCYTCVAWKGGAYVFVCGCVWLCVLCVTVWLCVVVCGCVTVCGCVWTSS